jgi:hypothetical protein
MKLSESQLRKIILEEISLMEANEPASVGKEIAGTAASKTASKRLMSNPALVKALDAITDVKGLASFLQDVIEVVSKKGIDQGEAIRAVSTVFSGVKKPS